VHGNASIVLNGSPALNKSRNRDPSCSARQPVPLISEAALVRLCAVKPPPLLHCTSCFTLLGSEAATGFFILPKLAVRTHKKHSLGAGSDAVSGYPSLFQLLHATRILLNSDTFGANKELRRVFSYPHNARVQAVPYQSWLRDRDWVSSPLPHQSSGILPNGCEHKALTKFWWLGRCSDLLSADSLRDPAAETLRTVHTIASCSLVPEALGHGVRFAPKARSGEPAAAEQRCCCAKPHAQRSWFARRGRRIRSTDT
jgi:hypothetical protein